MQTANSWPTVNSRTKRRLAGCFLSFLNLIIELIALDNGNKRSRFVRPRRQMRPLTGSASMSNACISSRQRLRSHRCKKPSSALRARGELFVSADGDRDRHQSWLLRCTNSLPSSDVGHNRGFLRIDCRTDRPVLIKAKQGEVPAHTHRASSCSRSSFSLRRTAMIPDEKLD